MQKPFAPILLAAFVWLLISGLYVGTVVKLDNTNIGTTNGLWKTPMVRGWEYRTAQQLDSGEWLYPPLYGSLCRLIPDGWVNYSTHGPVVTFRKMALLDAVFGGFAAGVVFLLAFRFLGSALSSLVVALAHAVAAYVMVNSINSEDIIPSYTFFLLMTLLLFMYLESNRIAYFIASIAACCLVTLLHWTQMVPALAGIGAVALVVTVRVRRRIWIFPVFLGVFLLFLKLFMIGFGHIESMAQILYPTKAGPSGFLGFRPTKLILAAIGIGNYFVGGANVGDYHAALSYRQTVEWMTVSWCFALVTLGALAWTIIRRDSAPILRLLAIFGLTVFFAGELEHLYSQPQDPQSQIQPMFASIIGVIVIFEIGRRIRGSHFVTELAIVFAALLLWAGNYNFRLMFQTRGQDSNYMRDANELARTFMPEKFVLVTHGWESFDTWIFAETFGGDTSSYNARNLALVNPFVTNKGIPGTQAADLMIGQITEALAQGNRVVADVVWVGSRPDFEYALTNLTDISNAQIYTDCLFAAFRTGRIWDTSVGKFVELQR